MNALKLIYARLLETSNIYSGSGRTLPKFAESDEKIGVREREHSGQKVSKY